MRARGLTPFLPVSRCTPQTSGAISRAGNAWKRCRDPRSHSVRSGSFLARTVVAGGVNAMAVLDLGCTWARKHAALPPSEEYNP